MINYDGISYSFIYIILYLIISLIILKINRWKFINCSIFLLINYTLFLGIGGIIYPLTGAVIRYNPLCLIIGGLGCFLIGDFIGKIFNINIKFKKYRVSIPMFSKREMLNLIYIFAFSCGGIYLLKNISILRGNIENGRIDSMSGNGALLYGMYLLQMIIPLFYIEYLNGVISKKNLVITSLLGGILLMISGFRTPTLTTFLIMFLIYWSYNKTNRINFKVVKFGFGLLFLASALAALRSIMSGEVAGIIAKLVNQLTVNLKNLNNIFRVFPESMNFQYGTTYLINIKMLAPGPDVDFTMWLKDALNMTFSGGGVTPSILGEFYINFGYSGVYLGMGCIGFICAKLSKYYESHKKEYWPHFIMWQFACCTGGGISNIYILILIFGFIYKMLDIFCNTTDEVQVYSVLPSIIN